MSAIVSLQLLNLLHEPVALSFVDTSLLRISLFLFQLGCQANILCLDFVLSALKYLDGLLERLNVRLEVILRADLLSQFFDLF